MSRFEELLQALLNGESVDIEPESRIEMILKNIIEGKGVEGLPEPQSRTESYLMALAEKGVGGGSGGDDVEKTIQALTITENGTYEAPEGVDGFAPVTVDVPQIDTSHITAEENDVLYGETFVDSKGVTRTGALITPTYYYGRTEPSNDLGVDGDLYLVMG